MIIALTLHQRRPIETPTRICAPFIGVEVDIHFVCFGCYDRRLEVHRRIWISISVAAAVVHQGRPIPIGDSDEVRGAGGAAAYNNSKGGEFKPQDLPTFQRDLVCLLNIRRIVVRMVW